MMSATNEEKEENEDDKRFTQTHEVDVLPLRDLVFEPTCPRERS